MELNYHIVRILNEEKDNLERMLSEAKASIRDAPEGRVRLKMNRKSLEFYYRKEPQDKEGTYIPVGERDVAVKLVQKRYLERFCQIAEKQLKQIRDFLDQYDPCALEKVFETENELRKRFVQPLAAPNDIYTKSWTSVAYEGLPFSENSPEHYTHKNLRVRSKSEAMIANALDKAGIPFKYECPLALHGQIVYPDFTILRIYDKKILYWEHFGILDEIDYRNTMISKLHSYESEGIFPGDQLIITFETGKMPLNSRTIQRQINHYLLPH